MCVISMIADHYQDKWRTNWPLQPAFQPGAITYVVDGITRAEFDKLRADVDEMLALLRRAKKYDEDNHEPDCENEAKMAVLRKVAEAVGVDLDSALARPQA